MVNITEHTPDKEPWFPNGKLKMIALTLQAIVNEVSVHGIIRAIAADLILNDQQYKSVGSIFYAMNNLGIADLYSMQNNFDEEFSEYLAGTSLNNSYNVRNLSLLAMLIARAEGITEISAEVVRVGLPRLVKLIQHESRFRKGIVKTIDYTKYDIFIEDVKPNFASQFKQ
jgi:hypothetical protein